MTNPYLEKIASEEASKSKSRSVAEYGAAYFGAKQIMKAPERIMGYHTVFHGTTKENAASIRKKGFDPKRGGSNNAAAADNFAEASKGKVYLTKGKFTANTYASNLGKHIKDTMSPEKRNFLRPMARALKSRIKGEGEVIKVRMPHSAWQRAVPDSDSVGKSSKNRYLRDVKKSFAAHTDKPIHTRYIKGSEDYKGVGQFFNKSKIRRYLSSKSGRSRAIRGVGSAVAGSVAIAGAAYSNVKSDGLLSKLKGSKSE